LAVRLAEGVNKRWICALQNADSHAFLNIQRSG
jgi:tRNA splicing endonuclease